MKLGKTTQQEKNKRTPRQGTRIRDPLLYTFTRLIKVQIGSYVNKCRGPGADQCWPCTFFFGLCEFIRALLSCFWGSCSFGVLYLQSPPLLHGLHGFPVLWGEKVDGDDPFKAECSKDYLSLCHIWLCLCRRQCLWSCLNKVLIWGYYRYH